MTVTAIKATMPLFGSKQKSPHELVRISRDSLATIIKEGSGKKVEKVKMMALFAYCFSHRIDVDIRSLSFKMIFN